MKNKPVTAIIVGAGDRSFVYGKLAIDKPDMLKITGVVDPNPVRRDLAAKTFNIPEEMCFNSVSQLVDHPKLADAIINGTMDQLHYETSIPLLDAGYDMLLEKPFAVNEEEMWEIVECAKKNNSKVMICHVLRYTPFYYSIKERIERDEIGNIINIQTNEHVSYHHISTSYVRGKWSNSKECKTTMLLAKCCHDIDLITWFMNKTKPVAVSSFGSKFQFKPENAPKNAGTICMKDCPLVDECVYSTKKLYIENPERWAHHVWLPLEGKSSVTIQDKINLMKTDYPFARCIYKSNNDVVDHQSVVINFANGATATHNMVGGASQPRRYIHIVGTKGEIFGNFESSKYVVSKIAPTPDDVNNGYDEEIVNLNVEGDMVGAFGGHGGGDEVLAEDFVRYVRGEKSTLARTSIFDSVTGHLCVYKADKSMQENGLPQKIDL